MESDMTTHYVRKTSDLDADKAKYKVQGFSGTASANTTTNIDWVLPQERWVSGGVLIAQGTHWGDKLCLQVIDIDNVLGYGANTVLDEYVTDFYLVTDSEFQVQLESPYLALIPAGVYIRIKYTNTSLVDAVEVAFNVVTHIPRT
jgi:hypothetical protein